MPGKEEVKRLSTQNFLYKGEDDVSKMNHVLELFGKNELERLGTKVILLSNTMATQLLEWKNKRNELVIKNTFPNLKRYK